jgi:hypothetical protein
MNAQLLEQKYTHYQSNGYSIFAVTLSTFVKSDSYAASDRMRNYWDHHFIFRVRKCLPKHRRTKLDHDFVVEESPDGFYHFHGLFAMEKKYECRIWRSGALHPKLKRAIDSHVELGKYRYFRIKKHQIEPVTEVATWCNYKQTDVYAA